MCTDESPAGQFPAVLHAFEPTVEIALEPVDSVVVTTLMDNVTDTTMPAQGPARRSGWHSVPGQGSAVMEDGRVPDALLAEHGLDCALMPSRAEIVSFDDSPPPPGGNPWVVIGAGPGTGIEMTDSDPAWPRQYDRLAGRIRQALGWRVLQLEHIGSTAVPGLAAKPVIDIDLTVADPGRERDYVPALESAGFRLTIREPWWHGHRMLLADDPRCNLHVFGFDSPELIKHRIFRDWLRGNPGDRDRYAAAKRQAASEANAAGEHVMQYNVRKQQVIREIYHRAFVAAGLLEP